MGLDISYKKLKQKNTYLNNFIQKDIILIGN